MATSTLAPAAVIAHGRRPNGEAIFFVSSQTKAGRHYMVVDRISAFTCTCKAGEYGKRCAHVEAVESRLRRAVSREIGGLSTPREYAMRAVLRPSDAEKPAARETRPAPRPLTAQMSVQPLPPIPGDTAMLYRSNAPFSIFKQ